MLSGLSFFAASSLINCLGEGFNIEDMKNESNKTIANHLDSEAFRKQGKVLDASEFNQIADTSPEAVEMAIASLKRTGMVKTAELIEATSDE